MTEEPNEKMYKSPVKKLVRFFEQSRDRWKAKSQAAKVKVKYLQNRIRFLERSKADMKSQVQALEAEVTRLKERAQVLEQTIERLQKRGHSSLQR